MSVIIKKSIIFGTEQKYFSGFERVELMLYFLKSYRKALFNKVFGVVSHRNKQVFLISNK